MKRGTLEKELPTFELRQAYRAACARIATLDNATLIYERNFAAATLYGEGKAEWSAYLSAYEDALTKRGLI